MTGCRDDDDDGASPIARLLDAEEPRSYQNSPLATTCSSTASYDESTQDVADRLFRRAEILAPMVRASTTPLRILALSHGASLTYTEELIDRAILACRRSINVELGTIDYIKPKSNHGPGALRRSGLDVDDPDDGKHGPTLLRIDPAIEKDKLIYQLGTGESQLALRAALAVANDVCGIDVNMGCPKKFSTSGGMGSALLSDVHRACDIVSTLRRNLPSNKPVSVKIRLLHPTDPRPTLDFVTALIKAGVNAIAIHGRIVGDESRTNARWETLITVVRQIKEMEVGSGMPIIINGDLYTRADINEMKRRSLCDGIMLARPALYNISLFHRDYDSNDNGEKEDNDDNKHDDDEMIPISKFQTIEHDGKNGYNSPLLQSRTSIVQEYIANCVRYRTHSKNAKYVILEMMNTRRAPTSRVPYLNMTFENGQTIDTVCKCRSLVDLVKIWDVKWTIPLPSSSISSSTCGDTVVGDNSPPSLGMKPGSTHNDEDTPHNYDDRYFLDHDAFIRWSKQSKIASSLAEATTTSHPPTMDAIQSMEGGDNEKKKNEEENCCDVEASSIPASKRIKGI